jgi:hypothetical protein
MESAELFTGDGGGDGAHRDAVHELAAAEARFAAEPPQDESESSRPRRHRSRNRASAPRSGPTAGAPPVPQTALLEPGGEVESGNGAGPDGRKASCTMAQMRRFIKSRPYVPIHELRRRFEIEGCEDEVHPVATDKGTIYVGLPLEEAGFLGDLIKAGEVGCELLLDPCSPAIVGVYAMRPVARQ